MKSRIYGSWREVNFNSKTITYICEYGYECDTHFLNGGRASLSYTDMEPLLDRLPRVYSYEKGCGVYLNPNHICTYSTGLFARVSLANGEVLKQLSGSDFEDNVLPHLDLESEM